MDTSTVTFDRTVFGRLADAEPGHFWFEERRRLIIWGLKNYFPQAGRFCEVGCGTGFVLAGLELAMPHLQLTGIDYYAEALPVASRRLARSQLLVGDICDLPFKDAFDVVGCFDVLEHIPDDRRALGNLARAIVPGGGLILTVPQHPKLWSVADSVMHHQRRYTRVDLKNKVEECGLVCRRITSFVTFLLPVMWSRRRLGLGKRDHRSDLKLARGANLAGRMLLRLECGLIARGVSFPVGGSLLVVATKPAA